MKEKFMEPKIQAINYHLNDDMKDFILKKLGQNNTYYRRRKGITCLNRKINRKITKHSK
ncbi:Ribosome-associated factor Y [Borrelia duttonii CR2A]|uniref:Ribosome-associated factor Y n=2 Tax=Borrelia duttonii TaxID=40834 RepID=W6TIQ6_9SPIR|nr:Ribosome-associated factor Y [Borrelia duttonii CR2A]